MFGKKVRTHVDYSVNGSERKDVVVEISTYEIPTNEQTTAYLAKQHGVKPEAIKVTHQRDERSMGSGY